MMANKAPLIERNLFLVTIELDVIEMSADMLHICAFHSADDYETAKKDKMDVDRHEVFKKGPSFSIRTSF